MTYLSSLPDWTVKHPLDPITPQEILRLKEILAEAGFGGETMRYSYVMLREPTRETVDTFRPGAPVPREIGALLMDMESQALTEVVVDIPAGTVIFEHALDPAKDGWGPVLDEDYDAAAEICKSDPRYVEALAKRGITKLNNVFCCPLSAGVFDYGGETGRRMLRVLSFYYPDADKRHELWGHPVDGVVCHVDLDTREVLRFIDTGYEHIPEESGDYIAPSISPRETMKPLNILQPEGASFTMKDNILRWENWSIRTGFNGREGLTLHDITFRDGAEDRSILRRASVSEMVVPYGEPTPSHEWQNYFDAGEYQYGRLANSLVLGCDCLGEIHYLDAVVVDDFCNPFEIKNAVCIHEEDYGTLWKHSDFIAKRSDVRRQRRLVVSFFVTVGNYDYGFYWYFYLDGTIELECKATGIVFTSGRPEGDYEWATEMAPRLGAPQHQHLFSARLDFAIDGLDNLVEEIDVASVPMGDGNPVGNAFRRVITPLETEAQAQRVAKGEVGRIWRINSSHRKNRLGDPTAYVIAPENSPLLMADPRSSIAGRAAFATKTLWVTAFDRDEMWAAGYTPNQHPGGAGLPSYAAANRSVENTDLVVWHTFGMTHFPRIEDWPVMPVDYTGFRMRPENFFDRNPTLDVPADPNGAQCCRSNKTRCH
ncbi:primary-amine oxidase [Celeribacter persicus]|uniref:Amine oxidase n=1 Tax=Celeribacter persicus TaxID=1651082 RepID=A0A2T5HUN7_9RHOB|nr:primary-amine oxidase [Celeribacter persicus]PTQ75291.1 primary-amine oxidase [Celeribacter persicus]